MRKLPLLLTMVVGVALWAAPSQAQVADFYARYVADSAAPGENVVTFPNGYELCPPNTEGCSGYSQAHHHIAPDVVLPLGGAPYDTNVLDVHNCNYITVCVKSNDNDATTAELYVMSTVNNDGDSNTMILADFNGDGVIDVNDLVTLDGDSGGDDEGGVGVGDGTARQTSCLYDITGHNKIYLNITRLGGGATDDSYAEVSCR